MTTSTPIDWQALAERLGSIRTLDAGAMEHGSTGLAREALELLLTAERLAGTVDDYVSMRPGFELARSVLWLLRPWSAMLRCREVFATAVDLQTRRSAVELLRVVADQRVLPWIAEFLADPDDVIQLYGIGIVDQLLLASLVEPEDCLPLLHTAKHHQNAGVRETAAQIEGWLTSR